MYKLFIDTHDQKIIYALFDGVDLVKNIELESGRRHGDTAMPTLNKLLTDLKIKISAISEIIVVTGPGSFTGVRIGVTIGKMLAYTLNIPIKTITSLNLYALNYMDEKVLVTIKDQKGIYGGVYDKGKLIDELFYMKNEEFMNYVNDKNDLKVIESDKINYQELGRYIKNLEAINVHLVNPCYVKVIEALK